jgi:hypothetical protein
MGCRNPEAINRYVVDDFVITSAGEEIRSRNAFKEWVCEFQTRVAGLEFETVESFQNAKGFVWPSRSEGASYRREEKN